VADAIHERALIAAAILATDKHGLVSVQPDDFEDRKLGAIWGEIIKHQQIDHTTLASKFGDQLLNDIITTTPSTVSIRREAQYVREAAYRRRLALALAKASDMAKQGVDQASISQYVLTALDGVPQDAEAKHIGDAMVDAYRQIEAACRGEAVNFVASGFRAFDSMFGGLQKGGLVVVAGRPSMGKTAFASGLAAHASEHGAVLMVSMEMSASQMAMRFLAAERGIDLQAMMMGRLSHDDFRQLADAVHTLKQRRIWINDMTSRTIASVAAEARRFKRVHDDMRLLVIDYLTLLNLPTADKQADAIGKVSRACKVLAGELGCPVVLLSQLNRNLEQRPVDQRVPRMSDLRDSGAIEQDADQIIFPYRPEVYQKKPENEGLAEIYVAKNRNGKTGMVRMAWRAPCAAFAELQEGF